MSNTKNKGLYPLTEPNIFVICHENEYDNNIDNYLINRAKLYNVLHDKKSSND